jgi:hypothetical protein
MDPYQSLLLAVLAAMLVLHTIADSPLKYLRGSLHDSLLESMLECHLKYASGVSWQSLAVGAVEFSTYSFWPTENPEFVEALADRML